jgi:hypothetical protein
MVDTQTVKDRATLAVEMKHLADALEASEAACRIRDDEAMKRIKVLEDYKTKTERYGFFLMGMAAVGTMIAAGFEKAVNKIFGVMQ